MADAMITSWRAREFLTIATKENVRAMKKASIVVQAEAKKLTGGAGSGVEYKRKSVTHRASAPGEPPARDLGILTSSISHNVTKQGLIVIGEIGPDIDVIKNKSATRRGGNIDPEYGFYLEVGTRNMEPRPFLRPALNKTRRLVERIFKKANEIF